MFKDDMYTLITKKRERNKSIDPRKEIMEQKFIEVVKHLSQSFNNVKYILYVKTNSLRIMYI